MKIADLLSMMKNVKGSGSQYTALCPSHEDKQSSLSISEGNRGIVLHCHAGCSVENIVQSLGIAMSDLFAEQPKHSSSKKEIDAIYDYTDINGKVVHSSIRYKNPKGFSQRRPDTTNQGKWVYNLKDITPVIYKLPQVVKAIKEEKPIFIVEGEKDADNLEKLGFTATTNPMGAGKWRDYFSDYLIDAICYIIPDNDLPGKAHAENVAKSLSGKAKSAKVIDLIKELPNLPEHGDITDFFKIIGDKKESLRRFNKIIDLAKESTKNPANTDKKSGLVRMADIMPEEIEWLWKPYIPLGKITLMRGDPGQGKTTVSLQLASIVSNGWSFPTDSGFVATEEGNVLYITAEDGLADTIAPRLIKAGAKMQRVFSYEETATEQLSFMHPKFEELIKDVQPRLVIVDPIQGYLGASVDGHKANEVRPVMHHIKTLAERYKCAIILIEHMTKNAAGVKGLYRGLGSIDVTAASRSILMVGSDPDNENNKGIAHIKHNLSKKGKVVGFSISSEHGLEWNPHTTLTDDIIQGYGSRLNSERTDNALEEAKDFLKDVLANDKQSSKDIHITANQYGISKATLKRAKEDLHIDCSERTGFGSDTTVYWKLPFSTGFCETSKVSKKVTAEIISLFDDNKSE